MSDPIEGVLECIKKREPVRNALQQGALRSSFLNNAGEVFEVYGFATSRVFLRDKRERNDLRTQADAVLSAIECMENCSMIQKNRAIGRAIIKTLNSLEIEGIERRPAAQRGGRR